MIKNEIFKVICDNCGRDLTHSGGAYDHCLHLIDRSFGPENQAVVDIFIEPLLNEDKYFCGFGCLKKWMEKNND